MVEVMPLVAKFHEQEGNPPNCEKVQVAPPVWAYTPVPIAEKYFMDKKYLIHSTQNILNLIQGVPRHQFKINWVIF